MQGAGKSLIAGRGPPTAENIVGSRRAHYRTVPNRWDQLRLEVVTSGGTLAAELLDISGSGLRLTLVEEYDRPAELGDTLTVRVHSDDLRQPLEIAALVVHLASGESAYTTGAIHVIDGGWTM